MIKSFQNKTPKIHPTAFIAENAVIIGDVEIAENASIWYNCVLRGDVNFIRIGANSNIQDGTIIHVSRQEGYATIIEEEVTVGHSATIHGCHIEKGSLIGLHLPHWSRRLSVRIARLVSESPQSQSKWSLVSIGEKMHYDIRHNASSGSHETTGSQDSRSVPCL